MPRDVTVTWICGVSVLLGCCILAEGLECGYPGSPAYGRPHPVRELYRPGDAVSFTCAPGYALQGPLQRVCAPNGTWAGPLPICDRSLSSVDHLASSRHTLSLYPANKSIDGDPRSCTYTDKLRPRWVRVDMRREHRVKAVAVTVPPSIYSQEPAHLTIYAISVRDSTTASYHKCASFNGRFSASTLKLSCSGGEVEGRYIHIEDNRNAIDYFSVCEIQVFVNKGSYECGEVERPAHAYSIKTETGAVDYRCVYGYRLVGIPTRQCQEDGQWSHSQPICQEIICPPLEEVEHGRIYYVGRQTSPPALGTTANVTCDYGFRSVGGPLRCEETGLWSEGQLLCEPIDCGKPVAQHDSEIHTLVNGTTYGSVALLQCGEQEAVLSCREDGSWSVPDFECQEQNMLTRLGLVEEQNDVPLGIAIGMAVVVFILLLIVILVLLMKRHKALRRNSAESLPSKDTGSTLAGQPTYENESFYSTIPVDAVAPETKRNFLSTILFTRKKDCSTSSAASPKQPDVSNRCSAVESDISSQGCIYEEVGTKRTAPHKTTGALPASNGTAAQHASEDTQPVYAQVNLDEKRRSRLVKALTERFDLPVLDHTPPASEVTYRREEAPTFDEVDLEPVKLRELPPLPDDSGSDITYASLSLPLEPPVSSQPRQGGASKDRPL